MWVSAATYERLIEDIGELRDALADERQRADAARDELATERGKREILSRQTAVQESFVEFLCSRVNQLETERVLLLRQLTTLEIPAPTMTYRTATPQPAADPTAVSIFDDHPSHAPKGWNNDGSVNYGDDDKDRRTS